MRGVSLTILAVSCLAVEFTAEALAVDPPKTAEQLSRAATVRPPLRSGSALSRSRITSSEAFGTSASLGTSAIAD